MDKRSSDEVWQSAQTLQEFGEATAKWLEGKLHHMPTIAYEAEVNKETKTLAPILVRLNRSGEFVTVCSQPANLNGSGPRGCVWAEQRAALQVFATMKGRHMLYKLARKHQLTLVEHKPGTSNVRSPLLVSREENEDVTWLGYALSPADIADDYAGLHPDAIEALKKCWQLAIVDPEWGRNDLLWPALRGLV